MRGWWRQIIGGWWDVRRWRFRRVPFSAEAYGWINGHFAIRYLYALHVGPVWLERWEAVTARLGVPRSAFRACISEGHPGYDTEVSMEWRGGYWPVCVRCGGVRPFALGTVTGETAPRPTRTEEEGPRG